MLSVHDAATSWVGASNFGPAAGSFQASGLRCLSQAQPLAFAGQALTLRCALRGLSWHMAHFLGSRPITLPCLPNVF